MNEFQGRTAIVAGASTSLGREIGAAFARAGATVVLSDIDPQQGSETATALGQHGDVVFVAADPTDPADVDRLADETAGRFGRIDAVVFVGTRRYRGWAADATAGQWRTDVDTGLSAAFYLSKACAPHMLATGGSIVNVGTVDVDEAYPGRSTVAATTNGLIGLSRALAVEWAPRRVRVNVVVPGIMLEPADQEAIQHGERSLDRVLLRAPGHRLWTAADVARAVLFLSGPRSEFITGQVLYADGGWNTWTQHPEGMRFP
jgi:meso-butanediol dehydrogenase / (S,S)-butanediol dehydrogenase / diacetyl reductase